MFYLLLPIGIVVRTYPENPTPSKDIKRKNPPILFLQENTL